MGKPLLALVGLALVLGTLPVLPGAGAVDAAPWHIDDAAGDQTLHADVLVPGPGAPVSSNPVSTSTDLRGVTIEGETPLGLWVDFQVASLKVKASPHSGVSYRCAGAGGSANSGYDPLGGMADFEMDFGLAGTAFVYQLHADVYGSWTGTDTGNTFIAGDANAYLCVDQKGGRFGGLNTQAAQATLDEATSSVRVWLPKESILGVGPPPFANFFGSTGTDRPRPASLSAGDRLTDFAVSTRLDAPIVGPVLFFPPYFEDHAPDAGKAPDYTFASSAANQVISVHVGDGKGLLSIVPGSNQSVPFSLENQGAAKRIVKMHYSIDGPKDKAGAYGVVGPAAATLSGGSVANFTLALKSPTDAAAADHVALVVTGEAVAGEGDTAYARVEVVPGPVLAPGHDVLFLHGRQDPSTSSSEAATVCIVQPALCGDPFFSTLEKDPGAADPDRAWMFMLPTGPTNPMTAFLPTVGQDVGLAAPVALDPAGTLDLGLSVKAAADLGSVRWDVTVSSTSPGEPSERMVAEGGADAAVGASSATVTIRMPAEVRDHPLLPAGSKFLLRVTATVPASPGAAASLATGGIEVDGGATRLRLPVVPLPDDLRLEALPLDFQLSVVGDHQDFANSGEGRLFNLTLLNQVAEVRDVRIALSELPAGWTAKVLPGDAFRLQPADTLRLGVLIIAPKDAKEGDRASVWANATREGSKPVGVKLTLVVTNGVDLRDDSHRDLVDPDAKARLLEAKKKDTPGLEAVPVLAALAALAWRRRR